MNPRVQLRSLAYSFQIPTFTSSYVFLSITTFVLINPITIYQDSRMHSKAFITILGFSAIAAAAAAPAPDDAGADLSAYG